MTVDETQDALAGYMADRQDPAVVSVYLYGSTVAGCTHRESDIDIGVLASRDSCPTKAERSRLRVRLASDLTAVVGTNDLDLVILNDVPPGLGRHVITQGLRVFCANPAADHEYVRNVQLLAADLDPFLRRMREIKRQVLLS